MKWIHTLGLLALAGIVGCEEGVDLVPITGTVTQEGQPLAGASVSFMPEPGNQENTPGHAQTGSDGRYQLSWDDQDGVARGKYKVLVTPAAVILHDTTAPPAMKDDPFMAQLTVGSGKGAGKGKPAEAHGEFDAHVTDKNVQFDFDIKSSPSADVSKKSRRR